MSAVFMIFSFHCRKTLPRKAQVAVLEQTYDPEAWKEFRVAQEVLKSNAEIWQ